MWNILVVEDNFENQQLLVEILRDHAHCETASNGKEAIEKYNSALSNQPYDLILLDVEMPEIGGLELLRKIRQSEEAADIPLGEGVSIIMVTAHKKPFLDAFYQGCNDYLVKPIDANKLIQKIEKKLGPAKSS